MCQLCVRLMGKARRQHAEHCACPAAAPTSLLGPPSMHSSTATMLTPLYVFTTFVLLLQLWVSGHSLGAALATLAAADFAKERYQPVHPGPFVICQCLSCRVGKGEALACKPVQPYASPPPILLYPDPTAARP